MYKPFNNTYKLDGRRIMLCSLPPTRVIKGLKVVRALVQRCRVKKYLTNEAPYLPLPIVDTLIVENEGENFTDNSIGGY